MDKDHYMAVRRGVEFYYFGSGCIADYYGNTLAYLNDDDLKILQNCYGKNEIPAIPDFGDEEKIAEKIDTLIKKGVLILCNEIQDENCLFHGQKGARKNWR